jgi:hypothetical protein
MDAVVSLFKEFGPWGLLLAVVVYILLRGEFIFRFPRSR